MRVVVLGAGAVGSLFGARLSLAGHDVVLIGRAEHVTAVQRRGIELVNGAGTFVPIEAETRLPNPLRADAVLVTVKTFDLARAVRELGEARAEPLPVLLPQNGLGAESVAVRELARAGWSDPAEWVVRAVGSVPATLVRPGVIREAGHGELLLPRPAGASRGATQRFLELFDASGIPVRLVDDLERELWRKAVVNAAINPVTATRRVTNGALREGPARAEAVELLKEGVAAAAAAGQRFTLPELETDFDRVVRATAENRSSMLQDVERGRPTEVDAILGALIAAGRSHGLESPRLTEIAERVRSAAAARKPS